ncbi:MAG: carbon storage regulator [Oscillibacter sp.]|nr:carbon storage regulator [Oscillibacter sp.]
MLILQRRTGESVVIGEDIRVTVVSIEGGRVRLAISAPPEVSILRSELLDAKLVNQDSAVEEAAPAELLGLLGGMPVSPKKAQEKGETRHDE